MKRPSPILTMLAAAWCAISCAVPALAGSSGTITSASVPTTAVAGTPFPMSVMGSGTCSFSSTILDSQGVAIAPAVATLARVPATVNLVVEQPGTYRVNVIGTPNTQNACGGQTSVTLVVAPGLFSAIHLATPSQPVGPADVPDCEKHFPSPATCLDAVNESGLNGFVLVWSFSATTCGAAPSCLPPTAYEFLMNDRPYGIFNHYQTVDASQTGIFLPNAFRIGRPLVCFEVRAVNGNELGPVSQPFCTPHG